MQTKDNHSQDINHSWKNLTHCMRNVFRNGYSIQCEIDKHLYRMKYHMRLIKVDAKNKSYEILVRPAEEGHDQDGLLCYEDHGIQNLRSFNVTSTSMKIGWSFYTWDIILINNMDIKVKNQNKEEVTHLNPMVKDEVCTINGLRKCEKYIVEVHYTYTREESRVEQLHVDTMCPHTTTIMLNLSQDELVIILLSCLLLVAAVVFLLCFFRQTRQRDDGQLSKRISVIDMNEVIVYDNLKL